MREEWQKTIMLEACDLITCGVAARPKYVDVGVPFLSAKNVKEGKIIYESFNCITEENHQELTKKNKPLVGDILYTRVGSYGEAAVIEEDIEFSVFVSLTLIKPKKELLSSYFLKYYLNSHEVKTLAKNSITSSGVGNLNVGTVRKFPVPIPPLSEQKQIVAILDKAFVAIDQAKTNIEKNIANAKELFQSKLNAIFSHPSTGSGGKANTEPVEVWEEKTLGEVCNLVGGGTPSKKVEEYYNGEIPWATVRDMNSDKLQFTDHQITKLGLKKSSSNIIAKNHVIIATRVGLGKVCILQQDTAINQDLKGIVPKPEFEILNEFIFWWYKSITHKVVEAGTGATVQGVKLTFVNELTFPLGKIEKQNKIVKLLNQFSSDIEKLEDSYNSNLENLEDLKKSILQKAFAGELTKNTVAV